MKKFSYLGGTTGARRTLCFRTNKELVDSSPTSTSSYDNNYVENFTLKHPLLFEICAPEICEKFVYRHSETIEYVKN